MAKHCEICGKAPVVGRQHSHANNVSARRFEPNLQTVRALPFAVRCKDCEEAKEAVEQRQRQLHARRGATSLFFDL